MCVCVFLVSQRHARRVVSQKKYFEVLRRGEASLPIQTSSSLHMQEQQARKLRASCCNREFNIGRSIPSRRSTHCLQQLYYVRVRRIVFYEVLRVLLKYYYYNNRESNNTSMCVYCFFERMKLLTNDTHNYYTRSSLPQLQKLQQRVIDGDRP